MTKAAFGKPGLSAVTGTLILAGLVLTSSYGYLLFHTLAEFLTIAVAWSVFFLAWNSRRFLDNRYLLFVGIASLFVGLIDLFHTMAFKGMGVFQGADANLPTQLWIAGRYVQSLSLLMAPWFLRRKYNERWVFAIYGMVVFLLLASIFFWQIFPACYIEGAGLTPFKIVSEYVICLILLAALALLWRNRKEFDPGVLNSLALFIGLTMVAEWVFTLYINVYDLSNLTGHLIRLVALYFLYRAFIVTGLVKPYDLLFRNLAQKETALGQANQALQGANTQLKGEIAERKRAEQSLQQALESLQESEQRVRLKLDSILSPDGDIGSLELSDVVDAAAIQSLMDDFYPLTQIPMSVIDMKGRVLVGVGWQEICVKFHRVQPDACRSCIESDLQLSAGLQPGEFRLYECKNHMWDIATPIMVGGQQVGNVFSGQFFFEGELPDRELFRAQAHRYGFDERAYLAALEKVPQLSRDAVNRGMSFLIKLAGLISKLSYSNLKLARSDASLRQAMENIQNLNHELELQTQELQAANIYLEEQKEELQVANVNMEEALVREHAARKDAEERKLFLERSEQVIRKLNQDLERRADELQVANKELESFSYSISHDLRTPLAGIKGLSKILQEEYATSLPDEARQMLDVIGKSAVEMTQLVEGLLSFSRFVRQPLKKQTVDMNALVRQVVEDLSAQWEGRPVEITIGDLPPCEADPVLLKQVFVNLLSNAIKFTRGRDPARIEVSSGQSHGDASRRAVGSSGQWSVDSGKRVDGGRWSGGSEKTERGGQGAVDNAQSLTTNHRPPTTVYYVCDNGVGFDSEKADRLFGVFQRLHSEEVYEGTGVGLAIVERIIRRHGGRVWAQAQVNRGATFYFTIGTPA